MSTRIRKGNPTAGDGHISRPLTTISVSFAQAATKFAADKVFPQVSVQQRSDLYYIYNRADWLRVEARERAPATESAGSGFRLTTDNYFARKYAFHVDVDDETRANAEGGINPDRDATAFVTNQMLMKREQVWASAYFVPGVWTAQTTPSPLWSAANSTPIEDIRAAMDAREAATGFRPNKLVLSALVWSEIQDHITLLERIKYTQGPAIPTTALLAQLLELDEVVVVRAVLNTANEGAAEATNFIVGKHALLVYAPSAPSTLTPSAGYIFAWTGLLGAGAYGGRMKRFRMEEIESDRIEGEIAFDAKIVANELGHFFNGAIA